MKPLITTIAILLLLLGCGKNKSSNPGPASPPGAASLVFPDQNSICISGSIISPKQSSVQFKWNAGNYTDSYVVVTKDLLTGDTVASPATQTQINITLNANTPYSWCVISRSAKTSTIAQSVVWKFYNSGAGVTSYAPFPADGLNPGNGQYVTVPPSGTITLSWQGTSVDNDIVGYDIYFGTTTTPPLYKSGNTSMSISNIPVKTQSKYYWKVVTHDNNNNTSATEVIEFDTN